MRRSVVRLAKRCTAMVYNGAITRSLQRGTKVFLVIVVAPVAIQRAVSSSTADFLPTSPAGFMRA